MPQYYKPVLILLAATLLLAGCYKKPEPAPSPPGGAVINDVRTYFPAEPGLIWTYEGEGNEYAAFVSGVMHRQDDKVQLYQDNGGTRMGLVYAVSAEAAVLVLAQEEFYAADRLFSQKANRQRIILKAPLAAGQTWETERERRQVLSVADAVETPSGRYRDVVKLQIVSLAPEAGQQIVEYYAPGVGLVLREFTAGETKIVSRLKSVEKRD